jgi:hypothetical protein
LLVKNKVGRSQGRAKDMGRKIKDRASPNRKTAKKQGKKNALKKSSYVSYNQKNLTPIAMQLLGTMIYCVWA